MGKGEKPNKNPKILFLDIETSPNLGYVWGKYDQDVIDFESEWHIMCFAYKWYGTTATRVVALPDFKRYKTHPEDDSCVVEALWRLFDEADVIVAHNGDRFDVKKVQARFIVHGFTPPSPFRTVDTMKIARRHFSFNSNKLDDLGKYFNVGQKVTHSGFSLWRGCMAGDPKSWRKMRQYNRQDVVLLEKVYRKLVPWINNHPSMAILTGDREACPKCGHHGLQRNGVRKTQTTTYQQFICSNCGGYARSTISKLHKSEKPVYAH